VPDVQEQMRRLEAARTRADELEREKSRLTGELEATKKRLKEVEDRCRSEFDCEIAELPGFVGQLEAEAEKSLKNAETVLGMNGEPGVPDEAEEDEPEEDLTEGLDDEEDEDDEDALV